MTFFGTAMLPDIGSTRSFPSACCYFSGTEQRFQQDIYAKRSSAISREKEDGGSILRRVRDRHDLVSRPLRDRLPFLVDLFPPQFQDDLSSRYAFPVLALSPSTPLPLHADYMKACWGSCVGCLCASAGFFSAQNVVLGCFLLAGFFWAVFSTTKSWKTYQENCNRTVSRHVEE